MKMPKKRIRILTRKETQRLVGEGLLGGLRLPEKLRAKYAKRKPQPKGNGSS
jgi:hypothetical protein